MNCLSLLNLLDVLKSPLENFVDVLVVFRSCLKEHHIVGFGEIFRLLRVDTALLNHVALATDKSNRRITFDLSNALNYLWDFLPLEYIIDSIRDNEHQPILNVSVTHSGEVVDASGVANGDSHRRTGALDILRVRIAESRIILASYLIIALNEALDEAGLAIRGGTHDTDRHN